MSAIAQAVDVFRARARAGRASVFRNHFRLGPDSKVLDIGSEDGTSIAAVLQGVGVPPGNIYIADIDRDQVVRGHELFGFTPVVIPEFGHLPFEDGFFDVVYCSSVIEHVTLPKSEVWAVASGREFRRISDERQAEFAREIRRLGRGYFVQTPDRWFPIESHTWLRWSATCRVACSCRCCASRIEPGSSRPRPTGDFSVRDKCNSSSPTRASCRSAYGESRNPSWLSRD